MRINNKLRQNQLIFLASLLNIKHYIVVFISAFLSISSLCLFFFDPNKVLQQQQPRVETGFIAQLQRAEFFPAPPSFSKGHYRPIRTLDYWPFLSHSLGQWTGFYFKSWKIKKFWILLRFISSHFNGIVGDQVVENVVV